MAMLHTPLFQPFKAAEAEAEATFLHDSEACWVLNPYTLCRAWQKYYMKSFSECTLGLDTFRTHSILGAIFIQLNPNQFFLLCFGLSLARLCCNEGNS